MVCEAHNGIHPNIIAPGERLFLSLIAGNREDPVFKHRRENPHNVHTYLLYINPRWPESEGPYAPRKHYLLLCASASYESPYADCLDTTVQPRLETVEAVVNPTCVMVCRKGLSVCLLVRIGFAGHRIQIRLSLAPRRLDADLGLCRSDEVSYTRAGGSVLCRGCSLRLVVWDAADPNRMLVGGGIFKG